MDVRDVAYEGRVDQRGEVLYYRKARQEDVKELAGLYKRIAIDRENYRIKLCAGRKDNFEHTGGMFLIMGEGQIRAELENPHSFWGILQDASGRILSGFWFSDVFPRLFAWASGGESLVFPVELVAAPEEKGRQIGKLMYYTIFKAMAHAGFEKSICDVYRVRAFEDRKGKKEVSLPNLPSRRTIEQIGGRFLGEDSVREIELPGLRVWVSPMVFELEYEKVFPACRELFEAKGILVY